MLFFLDFEATQPENEIIAVGAVAENGNTFYSLVKPQLSSISNYVSQLTHISSEDLEKAKTIDEVFLNFDIWLSRQEPDLMKWKFISYGDDGSFIKNTLPAITKSSAFILATVMMAKIENCYEDTRKFFHGPIKLIHAFNFVQSAETEQKHDPLEDALMLQKVYEYTQTHDPLPCHPLNQNFNAVVSNAAVKMPSGTFWCRYVGPGKENGKGRNFESCEEAIEWLINNVIKPADPKRVHRDRIMTNIMKAIRKKTHYCNFKWGRFKEEEKEENNK